MGPEARIESRRMSLSDFVAFLAGVAGVDDDTRGDGGFEAFAAFLEVEKERRVNV